jgi:hypothetical protein
MKKLKYKSGGLYILVLAIALGLPVRKAYSQFVTYSFTPCGAVGQFGPNQGQVTTAYSSTNLNGLVTVFGQGVQQFVVPTSGLYNIDAYGAQGGTYNGFQGGLGARMSGDVNLVAGTILNILVGQVGNVGNAGGGGGGSGVYFATTCLVAAGGGGGASTNGDVGLPGLIGTSGGNTSGAGGSNGNGGGKGFATGDCGFAGGGGGFMGSGFGNTNSPVNDGGVGTAGGPGGGASATNGGVGGIGGGCNNLTTGHGGFGFGGGGHGSYGGGGGGGYSGGGGGQYVSPVGQRGGGGGGSFTSGTNQISAQGINAGAGKVIITRLCNISLNSSSNPICIGQSVTLSTDAASNIVWSGSPSTGNSIVVSPNVTTTYSVAGTSTANCNTNAQITIVVNPLPVLSAIVTPTTLCVGKTATIVANGASTYTWNGGPTGTALLVTPGTTTSYNLTGTSPFGCLNSTTVSVNVNTNSLTVTPAVSLCKGSALTLTASGAVSYTWSNGSNFPVAPVSPNASITYTVEGIDAFGCKISSMVPVTVNSTPIITANASKPNACRNEPVTLSASGTANTYTWSNNATGPVTTIINPVDVVYSYTVTGEDNNGCTATAIVTVSVNKCVGINEFGKAGLEARVYPNPVGNMLTVELNNSSAKLIEITDLSGRLILSRSGNGETMDVDVTGLANGVYYVKLCSDDMIEVFKIVKSNQ